MPDGDVRIAAKCERCFSLCRCESRLRPGGSLSFLGLCHRARRGEGPLPVGATLSHQHGSEGTSVMRRRDERRFGRYVQTLTQAGCDVTTEHAGDLNVSLLFQLPDTQNLTVRSAITQSLLYITDFVSVLTQISPKRIIVFVIFWNILTTQSFCRTLTGRLPAYCRLHFRLHLHTLHLLNVHHVHVTIPYKNIHIINETK